MMERVPKTIPDFNKLLPFMRQFCPSVGALMMSRQPKFSVRPIVRCKFSLNLVRILFYFEFEHVRMESDS